MKRKRYTDEQIAFALRQADSGTSVEEICRKLGVSEPTFYRWKKQFAGMGVVEIRRLNELEEENVKLKRLVADLSLDKTMLQDVLRRKVVAASARRFPVDTIGAARVGQWLPDPLDPVLLVGGDFSAQWQARIEAQVGDGDKGLVLHAGAKVEFADDAAFVAHVMQAGDGAVRRNRRCGILAR